MAKAGPATTCGCTPNVKLWVIIHCSKAAGGWYISMHTLYCGAGSHRLRKGFPAGVCGATDGTACHQFCRVFIQLRPQFLMDLSQLSLYV